MADKDDDIDLSEARIHPFTVKDALYHHEKRLNRLGETTGDIKQVVASFEDKFKTLMECINEGVSPTMRRIEAKQGDIEKQIVEVKSTLEINHNKAMSKVEILDQHFTDKFTYIDDLVKRSRDLAWKVAGAIVLAGISVWSTMYFGYQELKSRVNSIPTQVDVKRSPRHG